MLPATGASKKWASALLEALEFGEVELGEAKKSRTRTAIYARNPEDPAIKRLASQQSWSLEPLTWTSDAAIIIALAD